MPTVAHPFDGLEVPTIALINPPLVRVIAQVRFPTILDIAEEAVASRFQRNIRHAFPLVALQIETAITLPLPAETGAGGSSLSTKLWRFSDRDDHWRATLAPGFVSLETDAYSTYKPAFEERLHLILTTVKEQVDPSFAQRVGIRYIQQLKEPEDLAKLSEYVSQEFLGTLPGTDPSFLLTQSVHARDDFKLTARWGLLPEGGGFDPGIPVLPTRSWILDIDTFDERPTEDFDPNNIEARLYYLSRKQYRFFRWAVEPGLLRRFGANDAEVTNAMGALI